MTVKVHVGNIALAFLVSEKVGVSEPNVVEEMEEAEDQEITKHVVVTMGCERFSDLWVLKAQEARAQSLLRSLFEIGGTSRCSVKIFL